MTTGNLGVSESRNLGIPEATEAAEYYFKYINLVQDGHILRVLRQQADETTTLFNSVDDERSLYRYAPDKWSIRETVAHVNDCERLFVFRAFWFARGFESPLPSFDQHVANAEAHADQRAWRGLIEEFRTVRAATLTFFESVPADAWLRRGIASDNLFTVRALAYIAAGHVAHHNALLRERYL